MKFKIYIVLSYEMRNTQFKNTSTSYTKSGILTKRLVLLPVYWETSGYEATPCDE